MWRILGGFQGGTEGVSVVAKDYIKEERGKIDFQLSANEGVGWGVTS